MPVRLFWFASRDNWQQIPRWGILPWFPLCTEGASVVGRCGRFYGHYWPQPAAQANSATMTATDPKEVVKMNTVGAGIGIGAGVGAAIGVAMDNIAVGVAVGVAIGAAIGASMKNRNS